MYRQPSHFRRGRLPICHIRTKPLAGREGAKGLWSPMPDSLLSIFPNAHDLLALEPEELRGVLLEIIPGVLQKMKFLAKGIWLSQRSDCQSEDIPPNCGAPFISPLPKLSVGCSVKG
jgi:hypothetical protein